MEREAEDARRSGDFSEAAAHCLFSVSFELNLNEKKDRTDKKVKANSVSLPRIVFLSLVRSLVVCFSCSLLCLQCLAFWFLPSSLS